MTTIVVYSDETDPDTRLAWKDISGALRNFVTPAYTMSVEVVNFADNTVELAKTTGVTGGDGTGASNVNIAWTAAELAPLVGLSLRLRAKAVNGTELAVFTIDNRGSLPALRVIPKPVP